MSTKLMTLQEAARFLGVTERTVRKYIKQGFLSAHRVQGDRRYWLAALDVGQFHQDMQETSRTTGFTKKDFLLLRSQVQRLQSQMDVVLRILDAKDDPLRMPKEYAKELFELCLVQSKATNWQMSEMQSWVEVFLRVDEEDLRSLSEAAEVRKPWKTLLSLCISMTTYVATHETYSTSLELQALHRQLAEGRRRLRVSALIYAELYTGVDPDIQRYALGDSPASVVDTLTRVLKGSKK